MMEATRWPAAPQPALLRAAFLSGDAAGSAWAAWRAQVDLTRQLDPGSFGLLPQLRRNVRRLGIDDPLLEKLGGVARWSWCRNQRAFAALAPVVQGLHADGIDVMPLGSLAMALRCPDYASERDPLAALLVRPEHAVMAIRRLRASGWQPASPPPPDLLTAYVAYHGSQRFSAADEQRLQLSWQWLAGSPDDSVWHAAEPAEMQNVRLLRFAPADHVLYVCAQGRGPRARPLFWRAIDVMLIVQAARGVIDWVRLVAEARRHHLEHAVAETLGYVQDTLDAPLPPDVVPRLAIGAAAPLPAEPPRITVGQTIARHWSTYRQYSDRLGLGKRIFYFPRYLQYAWRLDRLSQVPRRAFISVLSIVRKPPANRGVL